MSFVFSAVMGHVISTGLELMGTGSSTRLNERLASAVRCTVELANSQDISHRERLHVKAMELFSRGYDPSPVSKSTQTEELIATTNHTGAFRIVELFNVATPFGFLLFLPKNV